ncbi:MAG: lantibiotic ABC transporter [Spirochaetes bacterium GWF1_41_5]|nr:MAG: lantibiotic ABC transporter [Spirochaetes bacterium GWF1_41_5]HBE02514.1 lantibiotic ABC transporter [Spirochaetia bacterium]
MSALTAHRETLLFAVYYAPRGRARLYKTAQEVAQKHLLPTDLLIGIIGTAGSGKSTLIKGLFPGLELTNDDRGVNLRKAPIFEFDPEDPFSGHTFHLDVRYELAFRQAFQIAEAIKNALTHNRRVIAEHFDLIYPALKFNAHVLIGIGEEIIAARPTVFGPFPEKIKPLVDKTVQYRLMAHSAEDITSRILEKEYNYTRPVIHSDVRHGFVISFSEKPEIDISELEKKVRKIIDNDVPICPAGEDRIRIGNDEMSCTGTRTHVKSSGMIKNFRLVDKFVRDELNDEWLLVGRVGGDDITGFEAMLAVSEV